MPAILALLVLLAADPPPADRAPPRIGGESQLIREIEEEERLARERAAREAGLPAGPPAPAAPSEIPPPPVLAPDAVASAWSTRRSADEFLRLVVGVPLTWRRAEIEPSSGTGVTYRGDGLPYPGVLVTAEVFPARAASQLPSWLAPVGLGVSYSHGFLDTEVGDRQFDSSEQRAALDVLYERWVATGTRLGARAGYGLHRFSVDGVAPAMTARRHGLRIGLDVRQALPVRLAAVGEARVFPWWAVTGPEAGAHGDASGWGFEALVGVDGPIPLPAAGALGWRAAYDVMRFQDTFSGGGSASQGGSGSALHHGCILGLTYRR